MRDVGLQNGIRAILPSSPFHNSYHLPLSNALTSSCCGGAPKHGMKNVESGSQRGNVASVLWISISGSHLQRTGGAFRHGSVPPCPSFPSAAEKYLKVNIINTQFIENGMHRAGN